MAITVGTHSHGTSTGAEPVSFSHEVTAGTTLLLVAVSFGGAGDFVDSVVFNGTESLTKSEVASSNAHASFWYKVNPTATTANVVATFSGTYGDDRGIVITALNLSGTLAGTPMGADGNASSASAATITKQITSTADNSLIFAVCTKRPHTGTFTVDAGQTEITNQAQAGTTSGCNAGLSYKLQATAGNVTLGYDGDAGDEWGIVVAEVKAAAETPTVTTSANKSAKVLLMNVG